LNDLGPLTGSPDGTSIYLTRDIGGAIDRWEKYHFDKMIYVISSQQDLHVAQFFKVLKLMEFDWADRLEHVNYGLVQGMSTRKGTVVFLDQIIREASTVMHEQMQRNEVKYAAIEDPETVSREVGITGIKIQDMSAKRYVFSLSSRCNEAHSRTVSTTTPSTGIVCSRSRVTRAPTCNTPMSA
jgi:arginyl-tRNA synthetase